MAQLLKYDPYKVLGVRTNASSVIIKRAYRDSVKLCHPDVSASPSAHRRFLAVHEAYTLLNDPYRRMMYDHHRAGNGPERSIPNASHGRRRSQPHSNSETDRNVPRFAFVGLHLTGLVFGISIVIGVMAGYTFLDWPAYIMLMSIPGLVVIPDSINGLRIAMRSDADQPRS